MQWIQQTDGSAKRDEALRYYLCESHRLVVQGLSKKTQKALGLHQA